MPEQTTSPRQMFSDFVQIGVVVRDIDRAIHALTEIFGLGPFRTITYPPADRPDVERFYHGETGDFRYRLAFTELGPVEFELIEPLEGESIWADFLEEHGEGIHHIRFNVPDVHPVIEYLAGHDIEVSMMGPGLRSGTTWANFDSEGKVGFTIEIMNPVPGTDGRTPRIIDGKVVE